MNSKKVYFGLIAGIALIVMAIIGSGYFANSLLAKKAATLADLKAQMAASVTQEQALTKNKKDITTYAGLNTIAETIVPQDKDQAEAVREIVNLAAASGITQLSSVTFPISTLGSTPLGKTGAATSGAAAPSVTTKPNNGLTQVTPVTGITGVYDLQITVSQDSQHRVSYAKFVSFLQKLEQNRRTAQVTSINIQPDADNPSQVAFTLVIDEFIKP